jgi:phosphoribosylformimino-5-aminoimidazole carboxamide ribotide isomerase
MELIPAIDLRNGRVVRLAQGDDGRRTVFGDDATGLLAGFAAAGVALVHLVDLDAAFGEPPQRELVAELVRRSGGGSKRSRPRAGGRLRRGKTGPPPQEGRPAPGLSIQLGGGLRDAEAVAWALGAGCRRVVVGSMVVREPDLFAGLAAEHPGRLVPALDVAQGELRIAGWREEAPVLLSQACRRLEGLPCPAVLVTDIERDGMGAGPNLDLACRVGRACGMPALLSGGVASVDDLAAAARCPEIAGVVVGRALLDGTLTLEQALAACRPGEEA